MSGKQLRAIIDTNVYEFLYKQDLERVAALIENGILVVYGCKIIREELREMSKDFKIKGKNYRIILIGIYDRLVGKHFIPTDKLVDVLSEEYWVNYIGNVPKRKIFSDFQIVATATIHSLDIIVSEDNRTMKSDNAIKSYNIVNGRNGFVTPKFVSLEELIRL